MLNKILTIDGYGPFVNWRSEANASSFKRVNVVYGANGSGKSSLASMFQAIAGGGAGANKMGTLTLDVSDGDSGSTSRRCSEKDSTFWERVYVFNEEYVKRSLRFDGADGPDANGLLVLGEGNIALEAEIVALQNRIGVIDGEGIEKRKSLDAAKKRMEKQISAVRDAVISELKNADARYKASNVYRSTEIRKMLDGDRTLFSGRSVDATADLEIVLAEGRPAIRESAVPSLNVADFLAPFREITNRPVTVSVLAELANNAHNAEWVQQGIGLHEGLATCLFCASSITERRRAELAAHFDKSLLAVQIDADALALEMEDGLSAVVRYAASLPRSVELYTDIMGDYEIALRAYSESVHLFSGRVNELIACLKMKRANPLQPVQAPSFAEIVEPNAASLLSQIQRHNDRSNRHNEAVKGAARRIELHRVHAAIESYDPELNACVAFEEDLTDMRAERASLRSKMIQLGNQDANPLHLADHLTVGLARILGRDELAFRPSEDSKTYLIERDGRPAVGLSEGERTAISLLHFLAHLKSRGISKYPIVIIDDPVSSLDQNVQFGVSAHLWTELVAGPINTQVFILTHSFEFFRQWIVQLDSFKASAIGGHTEHELRMRNREINGQIRRVPVFEEWPKDTIVRRRLRSQYNFLFHRLARVVIDSAGGASLADQLEMLSMAPNVDVAL
ncbi:AAA family ATPase [Cryobacterium aureum]|uniref:AAA family ATPase n=1 Tax=Cryobacterium aureum TaxID=995037 RepID=UPI000CF3DFCF|nr:AAA family ATPase [Cryobacterium aureum]